jgi:hypothetical protein
VLSCVAMGYEIDGHEVAFVTTMGGAAMLANRTLSQGWIKGMIHRQPIAAMACFWAFVGVSLPLVVPPVRRALKLSTNQYDAANPHAVFPKYY